MDKNFFWVVFFDGNNWISYASSDSYSGAQSHAREAKEKFNVQKENVRVCYVTGVM